jgi:protein TonB
MQHTTRRSRALAIAFGLSLLVHVAAIPFVHERSTAEATEAPAEIVTITRVARTPTPPPPPPPRPTPPPRPVLHTRVRALAPRPVARAIALPRTLAIAPHAATVPRAVRSRDALGAAAVSAPGHAEAAAVNAPGASGGAPLAAPVLATSLPATPEPSPTPGCANAPHDAAVIEAVTPERPQIADAEGATGRVRVRVDLAASGAVVAASVYASSGNAALDAAAVVAAEHACYAPASDGCKSIGGSYIYVVDYSG